MVRGERFFDDYDIGRGLRDQAISILSEWSKRLDDSDSPTDKRLWALVDGLRGRIQNINNLDGKNDEKTLVDFLAKRYKKMPRTMLRYAIEKFDAETRKKYLNGEL